MIHRLQGINLVGGSVTENWAMENMREFCQKYQITQQLLDHAGQQYAELFRRIIARPPVSDKEQEAARRESRHDRGIPGKSLFICYTNRSGSSYLSDLLTLTGCCGRPQEYFTERNVERIARRFLAASFEDYVRQLAAHRQSDNGFFCTKVGFPEIIYLCYRDLLHQNFPNRYYLFLQREDKVMQAVSWYRAARENTWSSSHVKRDEAIYDAEGIAHYYQLILHNVRLWEHFFVTEHLQPLRINYEALAAEPEEHLLTIGKYLGITEPLRADIQSTRFSVQRDELSQEWAAKFRRDKLLQTSLR